MATQGKIALVTGAGSGIGRASALALMKAGFTVVLAGRRIEALEETRSLGPAPEMSEPVICDIANPDSIASLFAKVMDDYGRLDLLFNNAGIGAPSIPLENIGLSQWRAVIDTNLTGPFLCTQCAFRIMKNQTPQGGRIINNGSLSAYAPRPLSTPYTASKHSITGLTKAASLDGRAYNIAVGQIDIGNAETAMTEHMNKGALQPDGRHAPEPCMNVDDVGNAVACMASLPLDANVMFMTIMATKAPFVGRG